MQKECEIIRFPTAGRVTLEPDLQQFQGLGATEVKSVADRFFRYAKQLYTLHDIKLADQLWGDEQARKAARQWTREVRRVDGPD